MRVDVPKLCKRASAVILDLISHAKHETKPEIVRLREAFDRLARDLGAPLAPQVFETSGPPVALLDVLDAMERLSVMAHASDERHGRGRDGDEPPPSSRPSAPPPLSSRRPEFTDLRPAATAEESAQAWASDAQAWAARWAARLIVTADVACFRERGATMTGAEVHLMADRYRALAEEMDRGAAAREKL